MEESILAKINTPQDLKVLSYDEKEKLAEEIRNKIIDVVSKNGGHLASNLGVVELTIALHSIFDMPEDKIVWDVGHQTYVHKLLTGRANDFDTLRQLDGIAGFPKSKESEYDCFNTGHSSTSISAALGMARARDIKNEENDVIAIIGDGALTGGMALEALDDAGSSKTRLIVILNDNEMSISKNVGGISRFLVKIRTKKFYKKSNNFFRKILEKTPGIGMPIIKSARRIKYSLKQLVIPNMFFEDLGFKYLGPVDGHDIERVEWILELAKKEKEPVVVHIITKKGKGYKPAEENPDKYHSTGKFNIETGEKISKNSKDYSAVFGDKLVELAKNNGKIVAITAAMTDGTGLTKFRKEFPKRFFDVGIAEQHAICMAAGMAKEGFIPVVPIYSSFYQRAYDQVIHDVCIQNLPVVMCVDRAGIVGNDGETHQGILDLSFFNIVPNLTIMAPKDFKELQDMLEYAVTLNKPVVIRYPRGAEEREFGINEEIKEGKSETICEGKDITILAIGKMVARAMEVKEELQKENIEAEIINARFLKPFDEEAISKSIEKTNKIITIEDNIVKGGLASNVQELIAKKQFDKEVKILAFGYPDEFIKHGSVGELEKLYKLDKESIVEEVKKLF
ncbi:MAG: 1-deoxy-D-xylulose-5-phosphate synthase [Clostridia bacterium]|nr:1-deoxy-D-xylulose-5-phosphate synthase [Clostridia bacterium]